jgi:hypothetical protein
MSTTLEIGSTQDDSSTAIPGPEPRPKRLRPAKDGHIAGRERVRTLGRGTAIGALFQAMVRWPGVWTVTHFPHVLKTGEGTHNGTAWTGPIDEIGQKMASHASEVHAKKDSAAIVLGTTDAGSADTECTSVTGLFLDNDGMGPIKPLLEILDLVGIARIHQARGDHDHLLLPIWPPLAPDAAEEAKAAHAHKYAFLLGVLSEICGLGCDPNSGSLSTLGFDASVANRFLFMCYLYSKREPTDPVPTTTWAPGLAIDFDRFLTGLGYVAPPPTPKVVHPLPDMADLPPLDQRIAMAREHLTELEPTISKTGAHTALAWACTDALRGFVLPRDVAKDLIEKHFTPRCLDKDGTTLRQWDEHLLDHKLNQVEDEHFGAEKPWGYRLTEIAEDRGFLDMIEEFMAEQTSARHESVLVLRNGTTPLALSCHRAANRHWKIEEPKSPPAYAACATRVDGIASVFDLLKSLEVDPHACIARTGLRAGCDREHVRTRDLVDEPKRWVPIEFAVALADVERPIDELGTKARGKLPEPFRDASCVVQWRHMPGKAPGPDALVLYFWANRAIDGQAFGRLVQRINKTRNGDDIRAPEPCSPLRTARPLFPVGTVDPYATRLVLLGGTRDVVDLPEDSTPPEPEQKTGEIDEATKARISDAFGTDRKHPYTEAEISAMCEKHGCTRAQLVRRLVIQSGGAFYLLFGGEYSRPFQHVEVVNQARNLLAPAHSLGVDLVTYREECRPKKVDELMADYGTACANRPVIDLSATFSRYDGNHRRFVDAPCPLRKLTPEYNDEIAKWLELLGGEKHDRLLDWIAVVTKLSIPAPALWFRGPTDCGKTLLALGLARLWCETEPCKLDEALSSWNGRIVECPLVFGDEKATVDARGNLMIDEIKRLISADSLTIYRKFLESMATIGAIRMLLAANNDKTIKLAGDLTEDDIAALAERFLFIVVGDAPVRFLRERGGRAFTGSWVSRDGIAKHALWLRDNRNVTPGRFACMPDACEMAEELRARNADPLADDIRHAIEHGAQHALGFGREKSPPIAAGATQITIKQVLEHVQGLDPARHDRRAANRVAEALQAMGWQRGWAHDERVWRAPTGT